MTMVDAEMNRLLNLKVAKDRKGGPNTGSGRYSLGADTKSADKVRIWYQAGLVTA